CGPPARRADEVQDDADHRQQQQQVNTRGGHVIHGEPEHPGDPQNDGQKQQHAGTSFGRETCNRQTSAQMHGFRDGREKWTGFRNLVSESVTSRGAGAWTCASPYAREPVSVLGERSAEEATEEAQDRGFGWGSNSASQPRMKATPPSGVTAPRRRSPVT